MDERTLRRVQNNILTIAEEIKRVCEENGINYFLVGGTLIGAVRHGGFIPWDDDLDIGMVRSDYEKFVALAPQKLSKEFMLQTWDTDEEYFNAFAKVRMNGTVFREMNDTKKRTNQGFFVDVFPYDNLPDNMTQRKRFSRRIMMYRYIMQMKGGLRPWKNKTKLIDKIIVYISRFPFKMLALIMCRKRMILKYTKLMNKYNDEVTSCVCQESGGARFGKYPILREYISSFQSLEFENTSFMCPSEYDKFLRGIYGDYMKLPPKEEQRSTHGIVEIHFREEA